MKVQYKPAQIIQITEESGSVRRFVFKVMQDEPFTFKPGQFVMLDLPIESKITNRSYSIASAPNSEGTFELVIVLNPDGLGTPHIWENYKVGDVVPASAALGKFTLPDVLDTDLCLIGTGTGVAPLRSMLLHLHTHKLTDKHIWLLFGNRTQADILYRKELEQLVKEWSQFTFIPVLSRPDSSWTGRKGHVHPVYEELFSDKRPMHFYLCGWKQMILEAKERLQNMGYDRSHLKYELYD